MVEVYFSFLKLPPMQKVFYPKHIEWWIFGMSLPIGPIQMKFSQIIVVMVWWWISLGLFSQLTWWAWLDKVTAIIAVLPIFLITLTIAFFRISELTLIPFVAKMIQSYFIDTPKKYFVNYDKIDSFDVTKLLLRELEPDHNMIERHEEVEDSKRDSLKSYA